MTVLSRSQICVGLFVAAVALLASQQRVLFGQNAESFSASDLALVKAAEDARVRAIDAVYGSVVAIYGNDRGGGGSGVLFDSAGYALTNHHVVAAAGEQGWAGLADGKLYRWKMVGTDPGGDLAIVQLSGKPQFPAAALGNSADVRVGDWAMAMGNPFVLAEDHRPTVTLGIVSGVNRFQEGSGMNQLVYGNCIQVDSSINPGNSGGPLFNLAGKIIGINGRGSFEERGRVNVGLGYAISANQVKNFIPELLATKIAQHGTLDAVFGNRGGQVICHTLNLDSPIAKKGLHLGDRLLEFEGEAISDGNQLTNLVTTYPAHWPVSVVFEREGKRQTAHVRLTALPYEATFKPTPREKPAEEKPPPGGPDGKGPPPKMPPMGPPPLPLGEAGKVRNREANKRIAAELAARWQTACGKGSVSDEVQGIRMSSELRRGMRVAGKQELVFAKDGRCRAEYEVEGKLSQVGFDGKAYWLMPADKPPQEVTQAKALRDPHFSQAAVLASLLAEKPLARLGEVLLDGADKSQGRLCYRLSATDASSEQLFVWLTAFGDSGQLEIQLQKSAVGIDDDEPIAAVIYDDWQPVGGLQLPHRRMLVRGLEERTEETIVSKTAEALADLPEELFSLPDGDSRGN